MKEIPDIWLKFGLCIYQDFFADYSDFQEGILFVLKSMNSSEMHKLLNFVNHTLRGTPTNQHLVDLWEKSGASDILVSASNAFGLRSLDKSYRDKHKK